MTNATTGTIDATGSRKRIEYARDIPECKRNSKAGLANGAATAPVRSVAVPAMVNGVFLPEDGLPVDWAGTSVMEWEPT